EELADLSRTTPSVEGMDVATAEAAIIGEGLKVRVQGSGSTVIKQVPAAGEAIPSEGTVVLYTDTASYQSGVTTVPDFTGSGAAYSMQLAAEYHLNIQLDGTGLDSGGALAATQSIPVGTKVPYGTIIKVEFIYEDRIE
ncbi:MAG: PASTA domain-containing protein, partial [Clostridia bacterium]|nr:PASTA domain-containing protein [Clostridia bacterium]